MSAVFLSHDAVAADFAKFVEDELARRGLTPAAFDDAPTVVLLVASQESPTVDFGKRRVIPVFLCKWARVHAPPLMAACGIDASTLEPDEVADRIAEAVAA